MTTAHLIQFDPIVPPYVLAGLLIVFMIALIASGFRLGLVKTLWRLVPAAVFALIILNPSLLEEQRDPLTNTAIVAVDKSVSQTFGNRTDQTTRAAAHIMRALAEVDGIDVRTVENDHGQGAMGKTLIWDKITAAQADIPLAQRAGVIMITDGHIHDAPQDRFNADDPVHVLLSGAKNQRDRRIVITNAPSYGLPGEAVEIRFQIVQNGINDTALITTQVTSGDTVFESIGVAGEEQTIRITLANPGQNIVRLSVPVLKDEITPINNQAAVVINGVRDRLKVLLVTGQPYTGARTWRDLLKSDPGIDLVHFTILREPTKTDATSQDELSLIPFPFRELFEVKLYDFDLIIFDRYRQNFVLPDIYFDNVARYVREGGALFVAAGPDFAGRSSLANTSIGSVLPAPPDGTLYNKPFKPSLTDRGQTHPVTMNFAGREDWGAWLRQTGVSVLEGDTLMTGTSDDAPLLVLNRVGKGRVAQLTSDQIWLWQKGYDGGGPATDLLRRSVHWLMKEPELDEKALYLSVSGDYITVRDHPEDGIAPVITMTAPDGTMQDMTLNASDSGTMETVLKASQAGLYSFARADGRAYYISVGLDNPPEYQNVITSDAPLRPVIEGSKGTSLWLHETPEPAIRLIRNGGSFGGRGWIGLRTQNSYTVTGTTVRPLLTAWLAMVLCIGALLLAWWREGRTH